MDRYLNSLRSVLVLVLVSVLISTPLASQTVAGTTIYVDRFAPGNNNGTSWRNAYHSLQSALAIASYGDEIRVGQDKFYHPTNLGGDRTVSFQLVNGVTLRGGYAGFGEADPNARDITLYATILRGDLGAYHVVKGSYTDPNTILDGFTITGGNADGANPYDLGGGMYNEQSSPKVTNCIFSGNSTYDLGGGMGNYYDSVPNVNNCIFWGNSAPYGGNEIYNGSGSSTTVTYSDVKNGYSGTGNIDADPLFVDADGLDNIPGTTDDNLHLMYNSPCIDAGDPNYYDLANTTDLDGYRRTIDGDCDDTEIVDMGAYEFNYAYLEDFNYNCQVNLADFTIFSTAWMSVPSDTNWNHISNISSPENQIIDLLDLYVLCQHWLESIEPE